MDLQNRTRSEGRGTQELLTLYVVERWLARLSLSRYADQFVLDGGMLLAAFGARRPTADAHALARNFANDEASLDIDLYRDVARQVAEADLRCAAALDLRDWFRFDVGTASPIATASIRVAVTTLIGTTVWARFHVDLVGADVRIAGQPDDVAPLAGAVIPEVEQHGYRAYPLVDHVADKVAAMYERHGASRVPSTRYRDLVDLVAILGSSAVPADVQITALRSEFERRQLSWPTHFDAPDRALWRPGYAAEARRSLLTSHHSLEEALAAVAPFLDPLFDGAARGNGSPGQRRWTDLGHN